MIGVWIARAILVACIVGSVVPLYFLGPPKLTFQAILFGTLFFLIPGAAPFVIFGWSAWARRRSAAATYIIASATMIAVQVGMWIWWKASKDPKGFDLFFAALVVPPIQIMIWVIAYVLVGYLPLSRAGHDD